MISPPETATAVKSVQQDSEGATNLLSLGGTAWFIMNIKLHMHRISKMSFVMSLCEHVQHELHR